MADMILAATAKIQNVGGLLRSCIYKNLSYGLTLFFQEDVKSLPVDRALAILSLIQR